MSSKNFNLYKFLILPFIIGMISMQGNAEIINKKLLAGSYHLDKSRTVNIQTIISKAARYNRLTAINRRDLENKLNPPETISIDIRGIQVVLASSAGNPSSLIADGIEKTVYGSNGTKVLLRSSLTNGNLKVESIYNDTNYSIELSPLNNGRNLRVTRTVKTNYLRNRISATSLYSRISTNASFQNGFQGESRFSNNRYIVPSGTNLDVVLESYLSTNSSQNNDTFRMTIQSPSEFQGAMIEGYVSGIQRANNISGRAKMTLNFQKIKLPNGQTYLFSGLLQELETTKRNPTNKTDNNQIRGENKTNESIKRAALGTGIGAVIGAVVGGKKGAVIGAFVGGGAGTGTVFLDGRDIKLKRGSQLNIQSNSPD